MFTISYIIFITKFYWTITNKIIFNNFNQFFQSSTCFLRNTNLAGVNVYEEMISVGSYCCIHSKPQNLCWTGETLSTSPRCVGTY